MNDPTALLNFWDRFQDAQAYVSALPPARGRAVAWACVTPGAVFRPLTMCPHLVALSRCMCHGTCKVVCANHLHSWGYGTVQLRTRGVPRLGMTGCAGGRLLHCRGVAVHVYGVQTFKTGCRTMPLLRHVFIAWMLLFFILSRLG